MKLSIFTPTHNMKWIPELWESIKDQSVDFEWLIGVNGVKNAGKPVDDDRIRYINLNPLAGKIGALKRVLCEATRGDILVEVDHDDVLAPDALVKVTEAFSDENVDFVYSDCAQFFSNPLEPEKPFDKAHGWENHEVEFRGIKVKVNDAFPLTARSVAHIEYAPDHIRAWRKTFYDKIGRHDDKLDIGDDHDLVCRTYLSGTIRHIPECLYFYRMHREKNTYLKRFDLLQKVTLRNRDKYLWKMVDRWADLEGHVKIDLGGAHDCPKGYESFDKVPNVVHFGDAEIGLPFKDSSVGVFRAVDFLEHIHGQINLMNEIYRCLVPGGWLLSSTPSTDGKGAWCDPTHVSFWNDLSFRYYTDRNFSKYVPQYMGRFQLVRLFNHFPSDWHKEQNVPYVQAELCALKGQRQPGICLI